MIDSARIKKAEALFAELLDLPAPEREKQLLLRCGGDERLADLVRQLLLFDDSGMGGFLAAPAGSDGRSGPSWQPLPENARVGNFQLLRRIGEGGMGIVYEARQAHPDRIVALKVIRGGRFVDRYAAKLFQREIQALARLRHPCIGAIYEAGGTDDAQQFFAMELVQGRPLMEYVRELRLAPRDRLALFRRICDAIHYAHQRGVMHRDLKPSNILIDSDGNPRILDFGLARITDTELGLDDSKTAPGRIQGTLAYMSPEQARGDSGEIDIRSDVYSLGVILYELLTDRLPYDVMDLPLPRAVETICNQPPRKSDALKGDLETITHRALEKEPPRRYASAAALGDDIQRYLSDQPIEARRDSAWYVLRKALSRHRAAAAVALAFITLLSVSAVGLAVLYQREARALDAEAAQRRRAELETTKAVEERDKTERFARFMEELLRGTGPAVAQGRDTTLLKDMMNAAAKRIDDGELHSVPAAELRLREAIGGVYVFLADYESAGRMIGPMNELAKHSYGAESAEYARALENYAALLQPLGRLTDALAAAEEALAISQHLYPDDDPRIASCHDRLGMLLKDLGRFSDAVSHVETALTIRRRIFPGDNLHVAQTIDNLSQTLVAAGRGAEALPNSEEALAMYRRLYPDDQPNKALTLNTIGAILYSLGRPADALTRFEEAVEMNRRLFPGDHPYVGTGLANIGRMMLDLGRTADAISKYEESLAIHRRLYPGDHPYLANSIAQLAIGFVYSNRYAEALPLNEEALAMRKRLFSGDHPEIARSLSGIGTVMYFLDRMDEAQAHHEAALAMLQRLFPKDHTEVAMNLGYVAADLQAVGRVTEALPKHEEALAMMRRLFPNDNQNVARVINNLAFGLQAAGRLPEALQRCEEAMAMMERIHPPTHPDLCGVKIRKGSILVDMENYAEAEAILVPAWTDVADRGDVRLKAKRHCVEALIKLYETRQAADTDNGENAKVERYRALLARLDP